MLSQPPVESVNVTWCNCGFATYLLCLLIKQHTGILQDMSKSLLSIQATPTNSKDACQFYQHLGFSCYNMNDNGLPLTSHSFQSEAKKNPKLWIPSSSVPMSLFQLCQGQIILPTLGKQYYASGSDSTSEHANTRFCTS